MHRRRSYSSVVFLGASQFEGPLKKVLQYSRDFKPIKFSKVLFPMYASRAAAPHSPFARAPTPADATMSRENASTANQATFTLENEDHTLGNALRHVLNGNPAVELCGYSVPHPMERRVNVRVQTTGANGTTAQAAMRDALLDVISVCDHVHEAYEKAEEAYEKAGNKK